MLIVISGTPGTGKTSTARLLAKKLCMKLITTNYLVKKYKIKTSSDMKRKTNIIDVKKLRAAAGKELKKHHDLIFEGHLSHFMPSDYAIILRTSPKELERRMKKKKWDRSKIKENVEAEAIGIISSEAQNAKKSFELDTTGKTSQSTAALIIKILNNRSMQKKYAKKIDWTKEYKKYLVRG